jgi:hypothetical protein
MERLQDAPDPTQRLQVKVRRDKQDLGAVVGGGAERRARAGAGAREGRIREY